jgi:succinate dehydrogenase/fumarate reductase flavoprotein subunit
MNSTTRPGTPSGQAKDELRGASPASGSSIADSLARGRDAVGTAANDAMSSAGSDLQSLRSDLNSLRETFTKFVSQAGNEAAKSTREVTSSVATKSATWRAISPVGGPIWRLRRPIRQRASRPN